MVNDGNDDGVTGDNVDNERVPMMETVMIGACRLWIRLQEC